MKIFPACDIIEIGGRYAIDITTRYGQELQEELGVLYAKKRKQVQVVLKKPTSAKSEAQRAAFHALLSLYFKSGLHSSESFDRLKVDLKIRYGWVFDYESGGEVYRVIVSTEKYTMDWYSRLIDGTISEMEQAGILTSKYANEYQEIIGGMGHVG